ncbi:MAG: hypothetical protein HY232_12510 [Acidobacteria bacterium]|nr:hypothetical protein [Acidobacteriota bacterium]
MQKVKDAAAPSGVLFSGLLCVGGRQTSAWSGPAPVARKRRKFAHNHGLHFIILKAVNAHPLANWKS